MKKIVVIVILNLLFSTKTLAQSTPLTITEVTTSPMFIGGQAKLNEFVLSNFVSPEIEGAIGLIKISFVIEIDGSLTNIKIVQNMGNEFEIAAKNVFKKSPKWIPGELNGEKVRVTMDYPLNIR